MNGSPDCNSSVRGDVLEKMMKPKKPIPVPVSKPGPGIEVKRINFYRRDVYEKEPDTGQWIHVVTGDVLDGLRRRR